MAYSPKHDQMKTSIRSGHVPEIKGEYANRTGTRYNPLATFQLVNPVAIGLVPAIPAAAKDARHTGGVTLLS